MEENMSPAYVSRVLNRARKKISNALEVHADSHRLDYCSVLLWAVCDRQLFGQKGK